MRQITSVALSLLMISTHAFAATGPRAFRIEPGEAEVSSIVPRRSFVVAAMLHQELQVHQCDRMLGPKDNPFEAIETHVRADLESIKHQNLFKRFAASLNDVDDGEFTVALRPMSTPRPVSDEDERLLRRVRARMNTVDAELNREGMTAEEVPQAYEIKGRADVREFFNGVKEGAVAYENEHVEYITRATRENKIELERPRPRDGQGLKDFGLTIGSLAVLGASVYFTGHHIDAGHFGLALATAVPGISLGVPGLLKGLPRARTQIKNAMERQAIRSVQDRRDVHEATAPRATSLITEIDHVLALIDKAEPPREQYAVHSISIAFPIRNHDNEPISHHDIIEAERDPRTYDPVLNRVQILDMVTSFDKDGVPQVRFVLTDHLSYGPLYDEMGHY